MCGDFNNDGWIDVFTPDARQFFLLWDSTKKVFYDTSLLNNYSPEIIPSAFRPIPTYLNNDNYIDIVIFPADDPKAPIRLVISDGKGRYNIHDIITNENDYFPNGAPTIMKYAGEVEDLNGDKLPDIYIPANAHAYILWGIPDFPYFDSKNHPRFHEATSFPGLNNNGFGETCYNCSENIFNAFIEDVDKDGKNDIVTINGDKYDRILINKGVGRFNDANNITIPRFITNGDGGDYMMMDLNDDGLNDFVVATGGGIGGKSSYNNIYAVIQKQPLKFEYDTTIIQFSANFDTKKLGSIQSNLISYDFNNDGKLDIGFINASWGDDCGFYDSITNRGNILPYKTVFIREGNKFIEKEYYQYDLFAKSLLSKVRKRFLCSRNTLEKPKFWSTTQEFCKGDSIKINIGSIPNDNYWVWHYKGKEEKDILSKTFSDTGSFYINRVNKEFGCFSTSDTVKLIYKESPNPPVVRDTAYCANTSVQPLSAIILNNHDIYWSDKVNDMGAQYIPTHNTSMLGEKLYYATQVNRTTGCKSGQATMKVTVESYPDKPSTRDTSFCMLTSNSLLSTTPNTGYSLLWYGADSLGGKGSIDATKAITGDTITRKYYVSQISKLAKCESIRSSITVKINPIPIAPQLKDTSFCQNAIDSIKTNSIQGYTILWYGSNATGGTGNSSLPKPNTSIIGNYVLYASQRNNITLCESDRSKMTYQVKPIPDAPSIIKDTDNFLVANVGKINWYKDGVRLSDTTQKFKPSSNGNYSATTTLNGCTSSFSTAFYYQITSISNLSVGEFIKVFPNPTLGQFFINYKLNSTKEIFISLIDENGKELLKVRNTESNNSVQLGIYPKGYYFLQIRNKKGKLLYMDKILRY
jgi:hypothetical protein